MKHWFWEVPVGDMLCYLSEERPLCKQIIVIALNAKAFGLQLILNRAKFLKCQPEIMMNGIKL
jgi:hypothetical protein